MSTEDESTTSNDRFTNDVLSSTERAIAWAVVRSMATALWVAIFAMLLAWIWVAAALGRVWPWSWPLLAGAVALATVMEVKSRRLETPDPREVNSDRPGPASRRRTDP